jgi:hypothetical protein
MDGYLAKPIQLDQLRNLLAQLGSELTSASK